MGFGCPIAFIAPSKTECYFDFRPESVREAPISGRSLGRSCRHACRCSYNRLADRRIGSPPGKAEEQSGLGAVLGGGKAKGPQPLWPLTSLSRRRPRKISMTPTAGTRADATDSGKNFSLEVNRTMFADVGYPNTNAQHLKAIPAAEIVGVSRGPPLDCASDPRPDRHFGGQTLAHPPDQTRPIHH